MSQHLSFLNITLKDFCINYLHPHRLRARKAMFCFSLIYHIALILKHTFCSHFNTPKIRKHFTVYSIFSLLSPGGSRDTAVSLCMLSTNA